MSCRAIATRERELSVRGDNCFLLLFYELYSSNFIYTKVSIIFSPNNTMNMGYGPFFLAFFLKKSHSTAIFLCNLGLCLAKFSHFELHGISSFVLYLQICLYAICTHFQIGNALAFFMGLFEFAISITIIFDDKLKVATFIS